MAPSNVFGAETNASEVAAAFQSSIKDKVYLITGVSNGGIGGATAKALAPYSPRLLILAGRSEEKVNLAIKELNIDHPTVECRYLHLDLSLLASVRRAAAIVLAYPEPLHILINNAAVMNIDKRTLTADGMETQFQTNHIGPFLFTNLILPKLLSATPTTLPGSVRIINLSSSAHRFSPVRFSDINFSLPNHCLPPNEQFLESKLSSLGLLVYDGNYVPTAAYAQSKTCAILFTQSLNSRFPSSQIRSFSVHPGSIETELQRHADPKVLAAAREKDNIAGRKTLEQGASTTLVAALDPELIVPEGGSGYMSDCQFVEPAEWCSGKRAGTDAEELWRISEAMVGESFSK
ncbi:MAG: hypothetical protein Q9225_007286 [Loekoesia sp. 1 TL-2023]